MVSPQMNRDPLIHSFYAYSRIPIWIYSEDGVLKECYLQRPLQLPVNSRQESDQEVYECQKDKRAETIGF